MTSKYSVPTESRRVLKNGILDHPAHQDLPEECRDAFDLVKFEGHHEPRMAFNWRFAESVCALKGLEAVLVNVLLRRKYGLEHQEVIINTDHAQLFLMSCIIQEVEPATPDSPVVPTELRELNRKYSRYFPSWDLHEQVSTLYRKAVTNIYECQDGAFLHLHASLNPDPSLKAIGLPRDRPELVTNEEAWAPFISKMKEKSAADWDQILADGFRQASTVCFTPDEFAATTQGQAQNGIGLYQIHHHPDSSQRPGWWQSVESTSVRRPLAGLKVVDLTRIVAGPSIGRGLAELGASVMRVTGPHIADFSGLHPNLNWGKWNCHLDLRTEDDQAQFRKLVLGADVVVNGYRPGVLDKYRAAFEDIFELGKQRGRGFIYIRECCFGWVGPWAHRAGWQPISDACSGVSMGFGQAMGNNEPVTPVLPNSDYCTGIAGACAVLHALLQQEQQGGSFLIDTALNYYNRWLVVQVGEYPPDVWEEVWTRNGRNVFHHFHSMNYTLPHYMKMFQAEGMFDLDFSEMRETKALGLKIRTPKPVLRFPKGTVELGFNVGTRGNGVGQPYWPDDLRTEIVL
jgi:CoA-transferase family III